MDRIASFSVNHLKLKPGLYLSRVDECNGVKVSTFDMRFTAPNKEPVMDMPALHTIEHLGATFLRNGRDKDKIVYFGPMGCRTGCYLLMFGELKPEDICGTVEEMCEFICAYTGDIPGARPEECGNYLEQNLDMAKYYTARYLNELRTYGRFSYQA